MEDMKIKQRSNGVSEIAQRNRMIDVLNFCSPYGNSASPRRQQPARLLVLGSGGLSLEVRRRSSARFFSRKNFAPRLCPCDSLDKLQN